MSIGPTQAEAGPPATYSLTADDWSIDEAMIEAIEMKRAEIGAACLRHNVARLAVFGSAARGRDFVTDRSDADFLAEFGPWKGTDTLPAFRQDIEDILRLPVDVLDWKALSASRNYLRRNSILSDAETIFEA